MIPQALKERKQWLVWKFEAPDVNSKTGKPRKVPYYTSGGRRQSEQGSASDLARLDTFDGAAYVRTTEHYDGIGFAFLKGDGLVGIDLDNMVDGDGVVNETALGIVKDCASYAEWSPSGKGLHIYCLGETPDGKSFKSNKLGIEVFSGVQYFTVTGKHFEGTPEQVMPISAEAMASLFERVKGRPKTEAAPRAPVDRLPRAASGAGGSLMQSEQERIRAALDHVPAEDYQDWVDVGHALKFHLGDAGYDLWDAWSAKSAQYPGGEETRRRWGTFNPAGGVTIGTVFALAKQHGYRPQRRAAAPGPRAGSRDEREGEAPRGGESGTGNAPPAPPSHGGGAGGGGGDDGEDGCFSGDYDADGLPIIDVIQGRLPEVVDSAEAALLDADLPIYQRDRMLVRIIRRPIPSVRNYKRPAGTLGIMPIELPWLVETFTRIAHWQRYDSRSKDKETGELKPVRINCPDKVAATYMARSGQYRVPELWSVITAPTLRPDATALQDKGYDVGMKAWYDPDHVVFPQVPDQPTRQDAEAALALLRKAFSTFPWVDPVDESVAISLALSALVRRSLPAAPLGAITAPTMASGKTLIADCISILASGSAAPTMTYSDNEEEFKKTLLAVLVEGDPVVLMDNVSHPLQGDTLCSVLTSEYYTQRMLGRTEMARVRTSALMLANGNQLVIAGDLRTRALLCRLDAKVERPEERVFNTDLREWFIEHRPKLVAAGLTVMRAFAAAEKKNVVAPMGRFEHWSDMVRAPLVWLGLPDPCDSIKELEKDDPERADLRQVLHSWSARYGSKSKRSADVCTDMVDAHVYQKPEDLALEMALRDIGRTREGKWDSRRLSNWLRKRAGRRVDGLMFMKGEEVDHTATWKVDVEPEM